MIDKYFILSLVYNRQVFHFVSIIDKYFILILVYNRQVSHFVSIIDKYLILSLVYNRSFSSQVKYLEFPRVRNIFRFKKTSDEYTENCY